MTKEMKKEKFLKQLKQQLIVVLVVTSVACFSANYLLFSKDDK